jgi:hypothetical protein
MRFPPFSLLYSLNINITFSSSLSAVFSQYVGPIESTPFENDYLLQDTGLPLLKKTDDKLDLWE